MQSRPPKQTGSRQTLSKIDSAKTKTVASVANGSSEPAGKPRLAAPRIVAKGSWGRIDLKKLEAEANG